MLENDQKNEKVLFLAGLENEQIVSVGAVNQDKMPLKAVLDRLSNPPEIVSVLLKDIQVEIRGRTMKLVKFLEEDLEAAREADDDRKILFNVQLEDDEEVTITGKNRFLKPLQEVLDHMFVTPDAISVGLDDLQAIMKGKVMKFIKVLEAEQRLAMERLDLSTDMETFVLVELSDFMKALSAHTLSLLREPEKDPADSSPISQERLDELVKSIAQAIAEYLNAHFPICTPQLEEHSKEVKKIIKAGFEQMNKGLATFLANTIGSITDYGDKSRGKSLDKSLLGRIHDHPSNRAAIIKKISGKGNK